MALPDTRLTIQDGGLGLLAGTGANAHVKVGVSTGGTAAVNELVSLSDPADVAGRLGEGPLAQAVAQALATTVNGAAPRPVLAMKVDTTGGAAAAASAVTVARVGTSTGTVATTGSVPRDAYEAVVEITRTGTLGTGAFRYSLDDGDTYSEEIAIPGGGSYAVPDTGVTLVFTPGVGPTYFEDGDVFRFTTTPAGFTTTGLNATLDALLAASDEWEFVHVVGQPADATATATVAGAVDAKLAAAEGGARYVFGIIEAPEVTDAALQTAFEAFASSRVGVAAGAAEVFSPLNGRVMRRPAAWPIAARLAATPISEDPGRVASGPVGGVTRLHRDERKTPGLHDARFMTLQTIVGRQGFYVTAGRLMAPAGSDFAETPNRRVMNRACAVARTALQRFQGEKLLVEAKTGHIREEDARRVEAYVGAQLRAALTAPEHASDVSVQVIRTDDLLSTRELRARVEVTPVGYAKSISATIGFRNPALQETR